MLALTEHGEMICKSGVSFMDNSFLWNPRRWPRTKKASSFPYLLKREYKKKGPRGTGRKRTVNPRTLGLGKTKLITSQSQGWMQSMGTSKGRGPESDTQCIKYNKSYEANQIPCHPNPTLCQIAKADVLQTGNNSEVFPCDWQETQGDCREGWRDRLLGKVPILVHQQTYPELLQQ